jgi:protein-S-isoprenylcysteine O-methyltransferase Ste14
MLKETLFRWIFAVVLAAMLLISGYFRRKARQTGDAIPRSREGTTVLLARLLFAFALFGPLIAYIVNPRWMQWSSFLLPVWLRWFASLISLATLLSLYWVFTSIGRNISETYLTKRDHVLVTHGPYRWIRHPLYSFTIVGFLSLAIVASNWFMLAMSLLAIVALSLFVIPKEEAELLEKFGSEYRSYMKRTGRLAPRIWQSR